METPMILGASAFAWGALHALQPGHGKTLLIGTLVGSKRRWLDPLMLGLSTALGHTAGILSLTLISFFLAEQLSSEYIRSWLELVIGVSLIGASVVLALRSRKPKPSLAFRADEKSCGCCRESHDTTGSRFPLVCFIVGLTPCPSALALSGSAVGAGSFTQAVVLAGLFGIGMAATLAAAGILLTHSYEWVSKLSAVRWVARNSALVSAAILLIVGTSLAAHSLVPEHDHAVAANSIP